MTYCLDLYKGNGLIPLTIEDKDTLWLIIEAMLDNGVECTVMKREQTEDEVWNGKGEMKK